MTLVPDPPGVLTSNAGWNTNENMGLLTEVLSDLKDEGIRTSVFVSTNLKFIEGAKYAGADRVELYTEPYANMIIKTSSTIKPLLRPQSLLRNWDWV